MLTLLPNALQFLITSFLFNSLPSQLPLQPENGLNGVNELATMSFHLRHVHSVSRNDSRRVVFSDFVPGKGFWSEGEDEGYSYQVKTHSILTHRPSSFHAFTQARFNSDSIHPQSPAALWNPIQVPAPNVTDRETLLTLAKMTNNAYFQSSNDSNWYDLGTEWDNNGTYSYGWEPDADGFRGHVFVSSDTVSKDSKEPKTVVISIKGTSVPWVGGGPTMKKDKINDNLLFSCCCARVGPTWSTVCGCYQGGYKCDAGCVEKALIEESLFYPIGTNLYNNISYMYPNSNIWVIGHSLGGALASLVGQTFGTPVVAFEAPAEKMAAKRLHLPTPPSNAHITHVFNTADPIPMGTCTGMTSTCANAGYAMESRCHAGKIIRYDTIGKHGWSSNVQNHPIKVVINNILNEDWEEGVQVPEAVDEDEDCEEQECMTWNFI